MDNTYLYNTDFYAWTQYIKNKIANHTLSDLDTKYLLEEVESMGISELKELESRLEVLLVHLLKWQYQKNLICNSWKYTIKEQRNKIKRRLKKTPSLKSKFDNMLRYVYEDAIIATCKETGLEEEIFPNKNPYTKKNIMDDTFYPLKN